jgi:hypothetical protein
MGANAVVAALSAALAAEHAALYGYGVVGGQLSGGEQARARAAYDTHRARRDRLVALLLDRDAPAPAAAPGYALPEPVRDPPSARRLAAGVENALTVRYADLVAATRDREVRHLAATALADCALRATSWGPPAGAFPGLPERSAAVTRRPTPPPAAAPHRAR